MTNQDKEHGRYVIIYEDRGRVFMSQGLGFFGDFERETKRLEDSYSKRYSQFGLNSEQADLVVAESKLSGRSLDEVRPKLISLISKLREKNVSKTRINQ